MGCYFEYLNYYLLINYKNRFPVISSHYFYGSSSILAYLSINEWRTVSFLQDPPIPLRSYTIP